MNRATLFIFIAATLIAAMKADAGTRIYVETKPSATATVVRMRPHKPHAGAIRVAGYWRWNGKKYIWIQGHWVKPRRGYVYVPGRWKHNEHGWYWVSGHWKRVR